MYSHQVSLFIRSTDNIIKHTKTTLESLSTKQVNQNSLFMSFYPELDLNVRTTGLYKKQMYINMFS